MRLWNYTKTALLLAFMTALLVVAGRAIGGPTGMVIGLGLALATNFSAYWFSDRIVLAMHHARALGRDEVPWLYGMVERLAGRAGLPMPRLYLVDEDAPNAFATGRGPERAVVAVTQGLLRLLDREEIEGVLAHELAHVKNRDILIMSVAATLAGVVQTVASLAQWALIFGGGRHDDREGGGLSDLVWIIVLPLIALLTQLWISRTREYAADAEGARIAGTARGLASALARLEAANRRIPMHTRPAAAHLYIAAPLSASAITRLFATHPPMADRIRRLQGLGF